MTYLPLVTNAENTSLKQEKIQNYYPWKRHIEVHWIFPISPIIFTLVTYAWRTRLACDSLLDRQKILAELFPHNINILSNCLQVFQTLCFYYSCIQDSVQNPESHSTPLSLCKPFFTFFSENTPKSTNKSSGCNSPSTNSTQLDNTTLKSLFHCIPEYIS